MPIANSGKNLKASDKLKIITDGSLKCKEAIVKLLGMIIDQKLSLEPRLSTISKKVSQRLHAFARLSNYISQQKSRIIMKAIIKSQFCYSPLVLRGHTKIKQQS